MEPTVEVSIFILESTVVIYMRDAEPIRVVQM